MTEQEDDRVYIKEMDIWLKQEKIKIQSGLNNIIEWRELITLEKQGIKIRGKHIKKSIKDYNTWRIERGLKVRKQK